MQLNYVLYASEFNSDMGYRSLNALLDVSQRNNHLHDITGFLHIEDRVVLQYLEGPAFELGVTVDKIRRNALHRDFSILSYGPSERRFFDGWDMALVESTTLTLSDLLGKTCSSTRELVETDPFELISLLSTNASLLQHRYSVA
ncbi:BLUF domain-containing protein [uncultured Roseobacter sp.]|uniref:BLUF domain-containing protein n=1 Tax=uncultured Roseobacter sp. TaxID=114847 RepID=UPI002602F9AA|nr:BLUF domain-containing protein [uncultured Roseobacter sp.]